MRNWLMLFLLLVISENSLAAKKMPLPSVFLHAKKIALINETASATSLDKVYEKLKDWKYFEIVEDPNNADLVLVVHAVDKKLLGVLPGNSSVNINNSQNTTVGQPLYNPWWGVNEQMKTLQESAASQNKAIWKSGIFYLDIYAKETKSLVYRENRPLKGDLNDRIKEIMNDFNDRYKELLKIEKQHPKNKD
jgi:hypothetical protein